MRFPDSTEYDEFESVLEPAIDNGVTCPAIEALELLRWNDPRLDPDPEPSCIKETYNMQVFGYI